MHFDSIICMVSKKANSSYEGPMHVFASNRVWLLPSLPLAIASLSEQLPKRLELESEVRTRQHTRASSKMTRNVQRRGTVLLFGHSRCAPTGRLTPCLGCFCIATSSWWRPLTTLWINAAYFLRNTMTQCILIRTWLPSKTATSSHDFPIYASFSPWTWFESCHGRPERTQQVLGRFELQSRGSLVQAHYWL